MEKTINKTSFRGKLPDEILDQEKRFVSKGTNFKEYIETIILEDSNINFKNRKKYSMLFVITLKRLMGFLTKS